MKHQLLFLGAFLLAFCGYTADAHARRGIPIPIIWGSGEKMTEMGDLPPDVSRAVAEELGAKVTVAFLHARAHLFYLDLWTWNGRHVVRSGDKYWEPDSTAWRNMIGEEPSSKYGTPVLYRIPLLPALLIVVAIGYMVRKQFFTTDKEKLEALMNDSRYQRSIETMFGKEEDEASIAITTLEEQRFLSAKNQLVGEGVAAHTAESNLRKIADTVLANTNARIDAHLELASELDQQGEWDKSVEVYSQVISSLPDGDDRIVYARNCLASVNEKRTAHAAQTSDAAAAE